jgi:UDP-N-acetylglucosamine:LPS N-acetylglucosamine transferase
VAVPINGSSLSYNLVHELLAVFKKFPEKKFYLINFPTKIIKKVKNIYLLPFLFPSELRSYLKASSAVVSFAGFSTLSEIAYYNKPSLVLPLPNHIEQIANATYFRRHKLAEVVFPRDNYDLGSVERVLARLFSDLGSYSDNLSRMNFDFKGIQNAGELILKA